MEKEKIISLLADVFEVEEGSLTEKTKLDGLKEWDSVTKLSLIVFVHDEFGKNLTSDIIKKFSTVQDIIDFIGIDKAD